jgi:hypothetical protein
MGENEQRQHQFGDAAETDVEQAANGAAGPLGQLLSRFADPICQDGNRDHTAKEEPNRAGAYCVSQSQRQRDE